MEVTLSEKQALTENNNSMQQEMVDESAKSPDCFQDNKPSEKARDKIYNNKN